MESASSCMRRLKRSLVTEGRSSVCGKAVPSGPTSGGSVASAAGGARADAAGATVSIGATEALGVAVTLDAAEEELGAAAGAELGGAGVAVAGVETASPRHDSAVSSTEQPRIRTHRSRI